MLRVTAHVPAAMAKALPIPADIVVLEHDARRLRRKLLVLQHGDEVMVDFAQTTTLEHGDRLRLDDGSNVEVIAAEEYLYEIRGRDPEHLIRLAWHLGNRHLSAQLEPGRILIKRDHVIRTMLTATDRLMALAGGQVLAVGIPGEVIKMPEVKRVYLGT